MDDLPRPSVSHPCVRQKRGRGLYHRGHGEHGEQKDNDLSFFCFVHAADPRAKQRPRRKTGPTQKPFAFFLSFLRVLRVLCGKVPSSCGAASGSLARHSASGVSLSVIGQGTFAAAREERRGNHGGTGEHGVTGRTQRRSLPLCPCAALCLCGFLSPPAAARHSPRWVRMGRFPFTAVDCAVEERRRSSLLPSAVASERPDSPGRRPSTVNGARSHDPQPPGSPPLCILRAVGASLHA